MVAPPRIRSDSAKVQPRRGTVSEPGGRLEKTPPDYYFSTPTVWAFHDSAAEPQFFHIQVRPSAARLFSPELQVAGYTPILVLANRSGQAID